ncbi:MAG TPA: SGNH/GDSL hydrolase family protein [Trebonia sp.]|nr:SGNH/GDSL hydrolase family protein [Trebonia sp.]
MWSFKRVWLAGAGTLAATMIAATCLATPALGGVQPPPGASAAALAAGPATAADPATATATPTAAAADAVVPATPGPMVALGDSYTAGALLPSDLRARPLGCLRSTKAYPVLVAAALGASLTDVACASAGIKEMTGAEQTNLGTNQPQLSALAPDDSLVTLTLGGDDLGFMNVLEECMELSFTDPWGSPCQAHYASGGTDQLAALVKAEGPRMAVVLADIAARAPQARIVLVGYPDLFPLSGGCWPAVPITDGDIAYLRGIEVRLNATLAADARAAGATFVNTYAPTIGHDFCQPERIRDVEGLLPGSWAYPFHPNARGQAVIAAAVLAALQTP